jgi:hypothetical protein
LVLTSKGGVQAIGVPSPLGLHSTLPSEIGRCFRLGSCLHDYGEGSRSVRDRNTVVELQQAVIPAS